MEGDAKGFLIKLPGAGLASHEVIQQDKISLYPNPVKNSVSIRTSDRIESVEVYNTIGQLVFSSAKVENKTIDLSRLKEGVYFAKVRTDRSLQTVKLIKK